MLMHLFATSSDGVSSSVDPAATSLSPRTGAAFIFAIALLCAGQSASLVATVAGQIVSEGFLQWRVSVRVSPPSPTRISSSHGTYLPILASRAAPSHTTAEPHSFNGSGRGRGAVGGQRDARRVPGRALPRAPIRHLPARLAHIFAHRDARARSCARTGYAERRRRGSGRGPDCLEGGRVSGLQQRVDHRGCWIHHLGGHRRRERLCTRHADARGRLEFYDEYAIIDAGLVCYLFFIFRQRSLYNTMPDTAKVD